MKIVKGNEILHRFVELQVALHEIEQEILPLMLIYSLA